MFHPLSSLIDKALLAAEAAGEFDNLPGAGKPLTTMGQPGDAVLARILREANAKPPAVVLHQQIQESRHRLAGLADPDERRAEMTKLADLQTRLEIEKEAWRRYG